MSPVLAYAGFLLVIPAALAIGRVLGQLPTPEPAGTPVAPATDRTVATGSPAREPAPLTEAAGGAQIVEVQVGGPGPAGPAPTPAPTQESRRAIEPAVSNELSQWTTFDLAVAESRQAHCVPS